MGFIRYYPYGLVFVIFNLFPIMLCANGDMVIRGAVMRYDTNAGITTAEGGEGLATADFGTNESFKKLEAKTIRAKISDKAAILKADSNDTAHQTHSTDVKVGTPPPRTVTNTLGNDIEWIEAIDQVKVSFPSRTMTAERCLLRDKKIHCYGTVVIVAGKNHVKGEEGTFDLEHDRYEIFAKKDSKGQVEATLYPDSAPKETNAE